MTLLYNHPVAAALLTATVSYAIGILAVAWRTR